MADDDTQFGDFTIDLPWTISDAESFDSCDDEDLVEALNVYDTMQAERNLPEETTRTTRFPEMTDAEIDQLIKNKQSAGTVKMTTWAVKQFKQWLSARNQPEEFENLPETELDETLRRFYAEVRTNDGKLYSRSSYSGIRAALNRHIQGPPFNRNIALTSVTFHKSNQVYTATLKKLSTEGMDKTKHHMPISEGDMLKLKSSDVFKTDNPYSLQKKVWFDLTLNFARRGCENIQKLKKDAYVFKRDDSDREYVEMDFNEKLKNHPGDRVTENFDAKPRMYASACESDQCPVKSLKCYLSKLNPLSNLLFQQPRQKVQPTDDYWYTTRPVGEKTIGNFMSSISKAASLSRKYTNHCVRATTITMLSHAGVSSRAITRITKHRNESSLKHYENDSSEAQKRHFSDLISMEAESSETVPTLSESKSKISAASASDVAVISEPSTISLVHDAPPYITNILSCRQPNPTTPFNFQNCTVNITNHFSNQ